MGTLALNAGWDEDKLRASVLFAIRIPGASRYPSAYIVLNTSLFGAFFAEVAIRNPAAYDGRVPNSFPSTI